MFCNSKMFGIIVTHLYLINSKAWARRLLGRMCSGFDRSVLSNLTLKHIRSRQICKNLEGVYALWACGRWHTWPEGGWTQGIDPKLSVLHRGLQWCFPAQSEASGLEKAPAPACGCSHQSCWWLKRVIPITFEHSSQCLVHSKCFLDK